MYRFMSSLLMFVKTDNIRYMPFYMTLMLILTTSYFSPYKIGCCDFDCTSEGYHLYSLVHKPVFTKQLVC